MTAPDKSKRLRELREKAPQHEWKTQHLWPHGIFKHAPAGTVEACVEFVCAAANDIPDILTRLESLEQENGEMREALERIVGMVEVWTDEHGQRRTEEIYASRIARAVLSKYERGRE